MPESALYALFGLSVLLGFAAWVFAFGTRPALWLCLLLLPFRIVLPPSVGAVFGFENMFLVPDLLVPLTFLLWAVRRAAGRPDGQGSAGPLLPRAFILVVVAFLLSFGSGVNPRAFLSELEKWVVYVMTFLLVSQGLRDRADIAKAVNILLLGGLLATTRDLAAYLNLFHLPSPLGYVPNRDAFLLSSFHLQRYQGTGWPVFIYTLFLFLFARLALQWPSLRRIERWGLAGYAGLLLTLLVLSLYRGDWLALAGAMGAGLLLPGIVPPRAVRAMVGAGIVAVLLVAGLWGEQMRVGAGARLRTLFNPLQEVNVLARLDAYAVAWDMFRSRPLNGIGLGQYGVAFESYGGVTPFGVAVDPSYFQQANSDYFQYLATTGVLGLGALAVLIGSLLRRNYRLLKAVTEPALRAPLLACLLASVGFLITALSQDPLWDKTYGTLQFTVFGMVSAIGRMVQRESPPAAPDDHGPVPVGAAQGTGRGAQR